MFICGADAERTIDRPVSGDCGSFAALDSGRPIPIFDGATRALG
jgi:hypothetical protein